MTAEKDADATGSNRTQSLNNRRTFIKTAGVGTAVALAGCLGGDDGGSGGGTAGSPGDELADKLQVLTWGGSYGKKQKQVFIDGFQEEYGVEIEWGEFGSDWDLLSKQKASGEGKVDIVQPSSSGGFVAIKDNLLEPINLDNLENWDNVLDDFKNPTWDAGEDVHLVPLVYGGNGMVYNYEQYAPPDGSAGDEPKVWDDIFNDQTKGNISMPSSIDSIVTIAAHDHDDVNVENFTDAYEANMEKVWERIEYYNDHVFQWWDSGSTMQQLLTNESAIAGQLWVGRVYVLREEEDVPVRYKVPDDGTNFWVDSFAIAKGTKRKHTAEKFIDYTLRVDKSIKFGEEIPYAPGVEIPESKRPDTLSENDDLGNLDKLIQIDPQLVLDHRKEWSKEFQQITRG